MSKKLVITGMGAVTPIGLGVSNYWQGLLNCLHGAAPISRFDASRLPTQIAAEVKDFNNYWTSLKVYDKNASLFMQFALAAAEEALLQAGINPFCDTEDIGICMGTALGGAVEFCTGGSKYQLSQSGKISPHLVPRAIPNMASAQMSIAWGLHGPGFTISTACSAGGDAIMTAAMVILCGGSEAMLVMAGESGVTPVIISSLCQARALSRQNETPAKASRPFDNERDGFVMGEGGGAIFLETEEHAKKRNATILAELVGWANTLDGFHITAPDPEGSWAALCMRKALKCANLNPADIDYINAHGTGTKLGDLAETRAIKSVFGSVETAPPASSTKGATGHLMGAGGLTEIIACILAVRESILPPTLNLETSDPQCDLDFIPLYPRRKEIRTAMSNSLGFGGQNSSIIIKKYL